MESATSFAAKTFKREAAVGLLGVLVWQIYSGNIEMVEVIIWPTMTFFSAAAGIHLVRDRFNAVGGV